jgi:hypothetical protein
LIWRVPVATGRTREFRARDHASGHFIIFPGSIGFDAAVQNGGLFIAEIMGYESLYPFGKRN